MTIGTPAAFERESVQVKHHYAPAQVAVRAIQFVRGLIDSNLFDLAHDHGGRWRIFGNEGRIIRGYGCRVGCCAPARHNRISSARAGAALTGSAVDRRLITRAELAATA